MGNLVTLPESFDFSEERHMFLLKESLSQLEAAILGARADVDALQSEPAVIPLAAVAQPCLNAGIEPATPTGGGNMIAPASMGGFPAVFQGALSDGWDYAPVTTSYERDNGVSSWSTYWRSDDGGNGYPISPIANMTSYLHVPVNFADWKPSAIEIDVRYRGQSNIGDAAQFTLGGLVGADTIPTTTVNLTSGVTGTYDTGWVTLRIAGKDMPPSAPGYRLRVAATAQGTVRSGDGQFHFGELRINWE